MKFQCLRCGTCCCPINEVNKTRYIPIYLDEIDRILLFAKKFNKKIILKPDLIYPDIKNKQLIISTFEMVIKEKCEFFENGCLIYENRPITCKAYPVMVWRENAHRTLLHIDPKCNFVLKNPIIYEYNFSELTKIFSNEYKYATEIMKKGQEILYKILQLEMDNKIDIGFLRNNKSLYGLEIDITKLYSYQNWKLVKLTDLIV